MSRSASSLRQLPVSLGSAFLACTLMLGCSNFEKQPPRYNSVSGEKQPPIMNPGGANYVPPEMEESQSDYPYGPAMPAGMNAAMPVPPGAAMGTQSMAMSTPMPADMPIVEGEGGRKTPPGNQEALADAGGYVTQGEPVVATGEVAVADFSADAVAQQGTPGMSSALAAGEAPQPMESPAGQYQPMMTAEGEYPTLAEVPQAPAGFQNQAAQVKQEAAQFTAQSQTGAAPAEPMPAASESAPQAYASATEPALAIPPAPTYEQELQQTPAAPAPAAGMPAAYQPAPQVAAAPAMPEQAAPMQAAPEPSAPMAATPMQQASQSYGAYYEMAPAPAQPGAQYASLPPQPGMAQDYTVDAVPMAGEPIPTAEVYGDAGMEASMDGTGLPPIQLRAPGVSSGGASVSRGSLLPESRYAARRKQARAGLFRH